MSTTRYFGLLKCMDCGKKVLKTGNRQVRCQECAAEHYRMWVAKYRRHNRIRYAEYQRVWYAANRERVAERNRNRPAVYREEQRMQNAQWYREHRKNNPVWAVAADDRELLRGEIYGQLASVEACMAMDDG